MNTKSTARYQQVRSPYQIEECVTEKGQPAWTIYELGNLPAFHQKLGLWETRRAAKRYKDKLDAELAKLTK